MRGDSIQDLYAKVLALVGLGLLAGIGALVDYWPVGATWQAPDSPRARTVDALPLPLAAEPARRPSIETERRRQLVEATAPLPAIPAPPLAAIAMTPSAVAETHGTEIWLRLPDIAADDRAPSDEVAIAEAEPVPVGTWTSVEDHSRGPLVAAPDRSDTDDDADDDGILTGAFRTAASSIIKTGSAAGTSMNSVVRALRVGVRKALPVL